MLFGLCLLCGCEDALTVKPENSLTYENGLSTPKDFESFINGVDKALKVLTYTNEPNLQIKKGVYVDDYYDDSEMEWSQTLSFPSSELSYWNTRSWQIYYQPIANANVVLAYADVADYLQRSVICTKDRLGFIRLYYIWKLSVNGEIVC